MSGVMQWALIAAALLLGLLAPRTRRPARPCLVCQRPGRHRIPRERVGVKPQPALCCTHAEAFSMFRHRRDESNSARPHRPHRLRHLSQKRIAA